eukprot:5998157-Amphidinium_carterae.1
MLAAECSQSCAGTFLPVLTRSTAEVCKDFPSRLGSLHIAVPFVVKSLQTKGAAHGVELLDS